MSFKTKNPSVEFSLFYGYPGKHVTKSNHFDKVRPSINLYCESDKRLCMTGYCPGPLSLTRPQSDKVEGEIRRIASMGAAELDQFLENRAHYNPFSDRKKRAVCRQNDLKIRLSVGTDHFREGLMSPSEKRALVHDYERFVVARLFGGSSFARSRFSQKLYRLLMGPYGHIAHYDVYGFYEAQMRCDKDFHKNLQMVADSRTVFGMILGDHTAHVVDCDLVSVLSDIAKKYSLFKNIKQ